MLDAYTGDKQVVRNADVLNGIAWDAAHSRLFVTGKQWPKLYQVQLRPIVSDSTDPKVQEVLAELRTKCIPKGGAVGR